MSHLRVAGQKGDITRVSRAALRAQHLVMLIEDMGLHPDFARRRLDVSERTARRWRQRWGTWSADLRPHWSNYGVQP